MLPTKILNKLKKVNNIPLVNAGGCGVVAYELHKVLKRNNIKHKILYIIPKDALHEVNYNISNSIVPEHCHHAIIDIKGVHYDSTGISNYFDPDIEVTIEIPPSLLLQAIRDETIWNHNFDRKYIPKIRKILK